MNTTLAAASSWTLPTFSPRLTGALMGLTAAVIWGGYLALARAGTLSGLHAADIAVLRYGVAGLVMLPWLLRHAPLSLGGVGFRKGAVLALLVGPPFILIGAGGYAFAPLAHGAVIQPAAVTVGATVIVALMTWIRPELARLIGLAGIVLGLAAIAGPGLFAGGASTSKGDAMFVAAGLMWATFSVLTKRWAIAPLAATAAVSVLSALVYVPYYLVFEGTARLMNASAAMVISQTVVQGLLSGVVAVIAFTRSTQLLGAERSAVFPAIVPAVAILIGIPVTGEWPALYQIAGLALASLGLLTAMGVVRLPGVSRTA